MYSVTTRRAFSVAPPLPTCPFGSSNANVITFSGKIALSFLSFNSAYMSQNYHMHYTCTLKFKFKIHGQKAARSPCVNENIQTKLKVLLKDATTYEMYILLHGQSLYM